MILNNYYYYSIKGIPEKTCDKIVKKFYSKKFHKGSIKGGSIKVRESEVIFSDDKELYDIINPFIADANEKAGWNFQWDFTESCQFTKYGLNQYYNWHQDGSPECYPDDHRFIGYRNKCRKLSTVIALSDGSDYKGGKELRKKGTVIVFPSFVWHRVKPVLSGTRYSLVCWSLGQPWK